MAWLPGLGQFFLSAISTDTCALSLVNSNGPEKHLVRKSSSLQFSSAPDKLTSNNRDTTPRRRPRRPKRRHAPPIRITPPRTDKHDDNDLKNPLHPDAIHIVRPLVDAEAHGPHERDARHGGRDAAEKPAE